MCSWCWGFSKVYQRLVKALPGSIEVTRLLALLFAYRKSAQHEKAEIIAAQFEDLVAERIEIIATVSDLADFRYLYKQAQYYAIEGRSTGQDPGAIPCAASGVGGSGIGQESWCREAQGCARTAIGQTVTARNK